MTEVGPEPHEPEEDGTAHTRGSPRASMFQDRVVRGMAGLAALLLVLFLVTVLSALLTGVISPSGPTSPRTLAEKQVAVAGAAVEHGSTDPAVWGGYIAALISSGQHTRARGVISDARASMSVDDSATAEFTLAEARLLAAQGDHSGAIEIADAGMEQLNTAYDAIVAAGGDAAITAQADGIHPNYYTMALLKAYSFSELEEWDEAVAAFDTYMEWAPTAADVLIDRGWARLEAGDLSGAEEDFRAALRFLPDSAEALEGLEEIGATP